MTGRELVQWCEQEFHVKVDPTTVSRLLKRSSEFLEVDVLEKPLQKRARNVRFPELENAITEWCLQAQG